MRVFHPQSVDRTVASSLSNWGKSTLSRRSEPDLGLEN